MGYCHANRTYLGCLVLKPGAEKEGITMCLVFIENAFFRPFRGKFMINL